MPQSQSQSQSTLPFEVGPAAADNAARTLAAQALPAEPGVWDELRGNNGALRDEWRGFAQSLPQPPGGLDVAGDLERRVGQVAQRIKLDGVTHNVYSGIDDLGDSSRAWSLELTKAI